MVTMIDTGHIFFIAIVVAIDRFPFYHDGHYYFTFIFETDSDY